MTETTHLRHPVVAHKNGVATLTLTNASVEVGADGKNILVSSNEGFESRGSAEPAKEGARLISDKKAELNGVIVEQALDGHLIITAPEGVDDVEGELRATDDFEVGQLTENGVFFGYSTDADGTKRAWFSDIADAQDSEGKRLATSFNDAAAFAKKRNQENHLGHADWIVAPTWNGQKKGGFDALSALFNNQAMVEGFEAGAQYWSSTSVHAQDSGYKSFVSFKDGTRGAAEEGDRKFFRLARSVAV